MTAAATNLATTADLEAAPGHVVAEILGGRLHTRRYFGLQDAGPLTNLHHALFQPTQHNLSLTAPVVVMRPEIHAGGDVLVPEMALYRRRDIRDSEDWRDVKALPLWVLEWVAAATDTDLHLRRCKTYAALGIPRLWRVDSATKTVQTFHRGESRSWQLEHTFNRTDRIVCEPFPHLVLDLAEVWPAPSIHADNTDTHRAVSAQY